MHKTRDSTNSKFWPDLTCAISVRRKGQILLVVESLVLSTTASIPNNAGDHRTRAETRKTNVDEGWTKSREIAKVSYTEQNIGPITIRRDAGTTTSNDKPNSYNHAKRQKKDTNQM